MRERGDAPLVCHANGQKAISPAELAGVLSKFSHMLAEEPASSEEAEAIKKENRELKKANKELKSRVDLLWEKLGLGKDENQNEPNG